jgi:hypothetical protein
MAMDFSDEGEFLSGWVTSHEGSKLEVKLSMPGTLPIPLELSVNRSDAVAKGYGTDPICGFLWPQGVRLRAGDFVRLDVEIEGRFEASYSWLAGSPEKIKRNFNRLEFQRHDFQICDLDHSELHFQYSSAEFLKVLLVRLRRGTRGLGTRGGFVGHEYASLQLDMDVFRDLLSNYAFAVRELLGSFARFLFSVNDTFSDLGRPSEVGVSNFIGSFMMWERSFQTIRLLGEWRDVKPDRRNERGQKFTWGGMATHQLSSDDALDVYLERSWNFISSSELWIHFELLIQTFENPMSLHRKIIDSSDDYFRTWELFSPRLRRKRWELMMNNPPRHERD